MEFSFLHNHSLFTFSHIICIIGLILSETHILINISIESSLFQVPSFTLIYYTICKIVLIQLQLHYSAWLSDIHFLRGPTLLWLFNFSNILVLVCL